MKTGEPVIKVVYNGASASIEMYYYIENTSSNSIAAGSWVSGKGNSMVATVARAGDNQNSQWVVGSADGWSMPGSVAAAASGQIPVLGNVGGVPEVFAAAPMSTAGQVGYAAEFAVPWKYLRYYSGTGTTGPTPQKILTYQNIFTWHVSLDNGTGNNNSENDEDNAGGCCSGLAASGSANITVTGTSTLQPKSTYSSNTEYMYRTRYMENAGATSTIFMSTVEFSNISPNPPGAANPQNFTVTVFKDANNDSIPDGLGTLYTYNSTLSTPSLYVYTAPSLQEFQDVAPNGTVSFLTRVDMITPGVKVFTLTTRTSNEIKNTGTTNCGSTNITTATNSNITISTPLPVDFKSFTATRNKSNVLLKWVTSTEKNNSGFAVERSLDNATWQEIAFVPTQATGGNSSTDLSYQYIDLNNSKGVTQYRIKQVDIDSRSKYSEIRSVKGDGQMGNIIVYPNPTADGRINVVFDDANTIREIAVVDMSGRTVKQIRGISNNNVTIENLQPGMYSLRVFVPGTGEQSVQKIVVNKR